MTGVEEETRRNRAAAKNERKFILGIVCVVGVALWAAYYLL